MMLAVPCGLLCAGALAAVAGAADDSLLRFGRCLAAQRVPSLLAAGGKRLELTGRLASQRTLDAAFVACRQFVRWPRDFVQVGRTLHRMRGRGVRFRGCMRKHGVDPGPPVLFLADVGVGIHFTRLRSTPPPDCARLLPTRIG